MIKTSFLLLLIGHLLGDFYFQWKQLNNNKQKGSVWAFIVHSVINLLFIFLFASMFGEWWISLLISLGIGISHFAIDYLKWLVTKKIARTALKIVIFLSDQVIHIAVLFGLSFLLTDLNAFGGAVDSFLYENIGFTIKIDLLLAYLVSVMFLIQPANIINKYILSVVFGSAEASEDNNKNNKEARAGAIIGILERVVMYSFSAFLAWYSIFPVVLAAKTFARFEKFRKDDSYYSFSEKYIVGTLLSILYVGACLILGLVVA